MPSSLFTANEKGVNPFTKICLCCAHLLTVITLFCIVFVQVTLCCCLSRPITPFSFVISFCLQLQPKLYGFLPHDALVHSAVLRLHVVRPSVRASVCPSVCDIGGSGSHGLEIGWTISPIPSFALRSPKAIHLLPGEHGEIWGRLEVGWGKVACWSTKAAISLKRVKIEEKLLRRAYRNKMPRYR